MCPGRPKVSGVLAGSARARMVAQRSAALTPVVHPSSLSTVTVKGVPSIDVFASTWCGMSSSRHREMVIGAQRTPRAFLSMKLTCSGVIFSAATIMSPSFSRSSSSTTITILPWRKSSMASAILSSLIVWSIVVYCGVCLLAVFCSRSRIAAVAAPTAARCRLPGRKG